MKLFILEDDPQRIRLFREVMFSRSTTPFHDATFAEKLEGDGGAFELFEPPYDLICLDHDLGGRQMVDSDEEETGAAFVRWMTQAFSPEELSRETEIIIHSYNYEGAREMARLLREAGFKRTLVQPFGSAILSRISG